MPVRTGRGQHLQRHVHSPVSHAPSHARPHYPCAFAKTYERTATCCPACPRALWAAATGMGITVQSAVRAQILATALLRRPRHYHQAAFSRVRRGASRRAAVAVCSESAESRQSVGGLSAICRRFPGEFDHGWAEPTIPESSGTEDSPRILEAVLLVPGRIRNGWNPSSGQKYAYVKPRCRLDECIRREICFALMAGPMISLVG